ncbi:MAG: PKD domain-containing protein [Bacteroidales bacterium]|jgi:PKD repeat protein
MKKFLRIILLLTTFALLLASCQKKVTASFKVSDTEVTTGDTVKFYNKSLNAAGYKWDFGDGSSSTIKNPYHVYKDIGKYEVKLSALSSSGEEADFSIKTIDVTNKNGIMIEKNFYQLKNAYAVRMRKETNAHNYYLYLSDKNLVVSNDSIYVHGNNIVTVSLYSNLSDDLECGEYTLNTSHAPLTFDFAEIRIFEDNEVKILEFNGGLLNISKDNQTYTITMKYLLDNGKTADIEFIGELKKVFL